MALADAMSAARAEFRRARSHLVVADIHVFEAHDGTRDPADRKLQARAALQDIRAAARELNRMLTDLTAAERDLVSEFGIPAPRGG